MRFSNFFEMNYNIGSSFLKIVGALALLFIFYNAISGLGALGIILVIVSIPVAIIIGLVKYFNGLSERIAGYGKKNNLKDNNNK